MHARDGRFVLLSSTADAATGDLARAVDLGLRANPKWLPCRFFYDAKGSALFEEICGLEEYYLARAEDEILERHAAEIAAQVPPGSDLVELGSGSARKTRRLIQALLARAPGLRYSPIDISPAALVESAGVLLREHPGLSIRAIAAEYEEGLARLDEPSPRTKLVLWLGSNVGNFERAQAAAFLARLRPRLAQGDRLLVGFDLRKGKRVLERAYDDARGVTARFNKNLLARVNAELAADFDLALFRHVALYVEEAGRIEMHLESTRPHSVWIGELGLEVELAAGERIHTEDSYKYSRKEIGDLARGAGMRIERVWSDGEERFCLGLFAPPQERQPPGTQVRTGLASNRPER